MGFERRFGKFCGGLQKCKSYKSTITVTSGTGNGTTSSEAEFVAGSKIIGKAAGEDSEKTSDISVSGSKNMVRAE